MSISDNSTVAGSREHDVAEHLYDGQSYGDGDLTPMVFEQSPYADTEIISLHVGSDSTRFDIHNTILCRSPILFAKSDSRNVTKQHVHLPELDEATAHTLIHYLYTSTYQALRVPQQIEKTALQAYKLGTCVYCAAVRYQLPGLVGLAKEKITSFGEDVGISDILNTARDHAFPVLPDSETWYPEYLEGAIKSAMKNDSEPFRRPDFISQVEGNSRLLQLVWKTMMNSHASIPVAAETKQEQVADPVEETVREEPAIVVAEGETANEDVASSIDVLVKEPKEDKSVANEPVTKPIAEPITQQAPVLETTEEEEPLKLDEIEPTVELTIEKPQAPEPFTDELGYGGSKTYQKTRQVGKKAEGESLKKLESLKEPERPSHKRNDSVMQTEEIVESVDSVNEKEDVGEEKTDVATPFVVNGSKEAPKKNKKSKKKKNPTTF